MNQTPLSEVIVEKRWEKALREFERCRVTSGYSVESIFTALNPRGTESLPVREFAENLSIYCHLELLDALALGRAFDSSKRQTVSADDIRKTLNRTKAKGLTTVNSLLKGHPLFPEWLVARSDFQLYFNEWAAENGVPNVALVEAALLLPPDKRKAGDLQVLHKWIKVHNILVHVRDSRLLDVCQNLQILDCPRPGMRVVEQGDMGDAFYIVLDGLLDVSINSTNVGVMTSGMAFGEKALENNAPRAATVSTKVPSKLMVLRASEYKNLVLSAQAKMNQEIVEFLHSRCEFFKKVSFARLYYMVKNFVRKTYQPHEKIQSQGEDAGCVFVIMSGKVNITKAIHEYRSESDNTQRLHPPCTGSSGPQRDSPSPSLSPSATPSPSLSLIPHSGSTAIPQQIQSSEAKFYPIIYKKQARLPNITPAVSTVVHIGDISTGQVFGDDASSERLIPYSYGAVAKSRVEIIMINRKDILAYFKDKILREELLIEATLFFHADDAVLIDKHFNALKKHAYMEDLKRAALCPSYAGKMETSHGRGGAYIQGSRALSTKSLEGQIAKSMATQAQAKYQRVAITATMDVQARAAKSTRRASCISFLNAS
jgi:CRP-like cAMP-binding protein